MDYWTEVLPGLVVLLFALMQINYWRMKLTLELEIRRLREQIVFGPVEEKLAKLP